LLNGEYCNVTDPCGVVVHRTNERFGFAFWW